MQQKVEEAVSRNKGLRCAVPVTEPLTAHIPPSVPAPACTILAADGSQINPDAHGSVLFGLVNVGVFRIQPGSGMVPQEKTFSTLLYDDTLYTTSGMVSEDLIALLRDVREREILAQLVTGETQPVITLTDGPLELYHEPRQDKQFEVEFKKYLRALEDLSLANAITAGYVDRPRADLVVRLLELLHPNEGSDSQSRAFAGITDIALFADLLQPGERSAVFRIQSSSSAAFEGRKELHFFYLNSGSLLSPSFARVEIPKWVVENSESLSTLQAVLVDQSRQSGSRPYPYALIRAHEIAVVKMTDRQQLTSMIETELLNHGADPGIKSEQANPQRWWGKNEVIE